MNEKLKKKWVSMITDEEQRLRIQFLCVFLLIGLVAALMTVLNLITHKGSLAAVTALFSVMCLINYAIVRLSKPQSAGMTAASVLFMVELLVMFTYFIISGDPDGFSCIWTAMLPGCGMLVFGRKKTTVLCTVLFVLMVFFFWTAPGQSLLQFSYHPTFMARFPLLFVAFFSLSFLLETIRSSTQRELDRLRDRYRYLSAHDYLTDMLNRQGLEDWQSCVNAGPEQAVFMIDIDFFKHVNDSFGHDVGDLVLATVAQETAKQVDTQVCRWGGEEFVVWFPDSRKMSDPELIRKAVEEAVIRVPNCDKTVRITVSIGATRGSGELNELISAADEALYRAKQGGRNRVEWEMTDKRDPVGDSGKRS